MTHEEVRQRLQALANEIGTDVPTFVRDRSFPKQLSHPYGTAAEYLDNLTKGNPGDIATATERQTEMSGQLLTLWSPRLWMAASAWFANTTQHRRSHCRSRWLLLLSI